MKAWFILKNSISRKLWRADFCSGRGPCLRRVLQAEEGEDISLSVQFHVKNIDTLNFWLQNEGNNLHRALVARFGHKIAGFSTLLEEIDWEK